ncbi:Aste57867_274 [Aphanomyces stellatus]|uniref:Aste57867_274 protein n=1 Tax=Aphanomyces stellatus TaxID=120398 RepID=A0A485K2M9_9STRA|nr:hypothetical protein As57867_000274 [Aphanomyces stellatus]VFT77500.1 Aste57867_274 [Aphanomyces stellatus]
MSMNPFKRWPTKRKDSKKDGRRESKRESLESPPSSHEVLERESPLVPPPMIPRPTEPSEIDALFREAVDKMALPKAAADRMWSLPLNQKWQLVQEWMKKEHELQHDIHADRQPMFWIQKLQNASMEEGGGPPITEEEARDMHVLMRGSNKEWLHKFHRLGGVTALCEYMAALSYQSLSDFDPADHTKAILLELLRCYKTLMNNTFGMELLLGSTDGHVDILARCLNYTAFSLQEITITVLELLSVLCWYSDRGQHVVLTAMTSYRRLHKERASYWSIVQCLKSTESSVELQAACLTFINTLVSASPRLEDRMSVRNDFLALDLLVVCHAIQTKLEAPPSPRGLYGVVVEKMTPAAKAFVKQVAVFEGLLHSDHADMEDALEAKLNVNNVDAVFGELKQWTQRHGFGDRLLHVLVALMGIPGEATIGAKMWELSEEALVNITSLHTFKDLEDAPRKLSFEWVRGIRQTVEEFQSQVQTIQTLQSTIAAMDAQSKRCHATVKERNQEIKDLNNKLEDIRLDQLKHQSIVPQTTQTELEMTNAGVQTESIHQATTTTQTDDVAIISVAAAVAPTPAYDKYLKLLKMGMPKEQVMLKCKADGLDMTYLESLTTTTLTTNEVAETPKVDPKYEKYVKLLKMGMPKDQVMLKCKADGLDPAVLDAPPPEASSEMTASMATATEVLMKAASYKALPTHVLTDGMAAAPDGTMVATETVSAPVDPRLEKYRKLLKMGMPREQVGLKMQSEGLDIALLVDVSLPLAATCEPVVEAAPLVDPAYEKLFKLLKMGMPMEQVQFKAKAAGLDPDKLALPPPPRASMAIPPQPTATLDSKYDKYFKLLKMGMPLEQVKLKAAADGLDASVLDGPASQPSVLPATLPTQKATCPCEATPIPAAPVTTAAPPASVVPKLPPKKSTLPSIKLRCLYWTPLPDAAVVGSIWSKMDDASKLPLDLTLLDKEFGQESGKKAPEANNATSSKFALHKPKVVHLVDSKRQQNCSIALSRFRMTPKDIKDAIVHLDDKVLTLDRIQSLEAMVPTAEELDLVKGYDGAVALLGETEKFFLAILDLPRLAQRLRAMHSTMTFATRYEDVKAKLKTLEQAYGDLKGSDKLVSVLEVVLVVGNYMNGGTARGGAWGFKLDILPKLSLVKATSTASKTLLHCIADFVFSTVPSASDFYESLKSLDDASTISFTLLQSDFRAIEASLEQIAQEIPHQDDPFGSKMGAFLSTAQADCQSLQRNMASFETHFHELTLSFGFDSSKPSGDVVSDLDIWPLKSAMCVFVQDAVHGFFGTWAEFCKTYKRVAIENERLREKQTKQDAKTKLDDHSKRDLFQQFTDTLEGDASDIVANYRSRHRHGDAPKKSVLPPPRRSISTVDGPATQ